MPPDDSSNPLDKTPDMANLTPAERARIYKERAAAAGLGRAPAAGGGQPPAQQPPAAKPPAEKPAAPPPAAASAAGGGSEPPKRPAPSTGGAGDGGPLGKTPDMANLTPAERARIYKERAAAAGLGRPPAAGQEGAAPAPAATPAPAPAERPAAAAARPAGGGGASALSPEQRQRLAAAVQRGSGGAPAAAPAATAAPSAVEAQSQRLVYVWPHLVMIEFMAAVLLLVSMIVIAMVIQAPLEGHANPDKTPNPSKAPWYFLNLQELLLHMHPALAGVIVPAVALGLIALIPYFDRDNSDVGKWFGTPKAIGIAWFTAWYTTVVLIVLVLFDEFVSVKRMLRWLADVTNVELFYDPFVFNILVPTLFMLGPIWPLVWIIKKRYKPDGARDWMICLFTGFFVTYIILTVVGTFFRGQGMHLMWPWDPRQVRVE